MIYHTHTYYTYTYYIIRTRTISAGPPAAPACQAFFMPSL